MKLSLYSLKKILYWHENSPFIILPFPISLSFKCSHLCLGWSSKPFPWLSGPKLRFPVVFVTFSSWAFCSQVGTCPSEHKPWEDNFKVQDGTKILLLYKAVVVLGAGFGGRRLTEGKESCLLKIQGGLHDKTSALLLRASSLCLHFSAFQNFS